MKDSEVDGESRRPLDSDKNPGILFSNRGTCILAIRKWLFQDYSHLDRIVYGKNSLTGEFQC